MLRRRPLMRAAATTAVVAGTATAVSGRVGRRQQAKADQAAAAQPVDQQPAPVEEAPPPAAPPSTGLSLEAMDQLKELAALKEQGVLTDAEFTAEKAKLLGS